MLFASLIFFTVLFPCIERTFVIINYKSVACQNWMYDSLAGTSMNQDLFFYVLFFRIVISFYCSFLCFLFLHSFSSTNSHLVLLVVISISLLKLPLFYFGLWFLAGLSAEVLLVFSHLTMLG